MNSDNEHHEEEHDQPMIWHRLNRWLTIGLVLGVIAVVICKFLPELQKQKVARAEEEQLMLLIKQRRDSLNRKTREISWLKNDPNYVEIIARDRLDLMKDGETIYRIETPKPPAK